METPDERAAIFDQLSPIGQALLEIAHGDREKFPPAEELDKEEYEGYGFVEEDPGIFDKYIVAIDRFMESEATIIAIGLRMGIMVQPRTGEPVAARLISILLFVLDRLTKDPNIARDMAEVVDMREEEWQRRARAIGDDPTNNDYDDRLIVFIAERIPSPTDTPSERDDEPLDPTYQA